MRVRLFWRADTPEAGRFSPQPFGCSHPLLVPARSRARGAKRPSYVTQRPWRDTALALHAGGHWFEPGTAHREKAWKHGLLVARRATEDGGRGANKQRRLRNKPSRAREGEAASFGRVPAHTARNACGASSTCTSAWRTCSAGGAQSSATASPSTTPNGGSSRRPSSAGSGAAWSAKRLARPRATRLSSSSMDSCSISSTLDGTKNHAVPSAARAPDRSTGSAPSPQPNHQQAAASRSKWPTAFCRPSPPPRTSFSAITALVPSLWSWRTGREGLEPPRGSPSGVPRRWTVCD